MDTQSRIKYILLFVFIFSGCSLMKHGINVNPSLVGVSPAQDANLVKTGDIVPIKAPISANAQSPIGADNRATTVGRDFQNKEVTVNDSKVVSQNEKHWYMLCVALLLAWGRSEWRASRLLGIVLKEQCEQVERLEKMLINQKEKNT